MAMISKTRQKNKYRITLEMEVNEDFNPYELDWKKVFDLNKNEKVKSYVEDLSLPICVSYKM
jgi:hypothetical protein|tara:strand:+ start:300 stop:485 length:186 start_codon:yes stop_codon:yes gene_type:complete